MAQSPLNSLAARSGGAFPKNYLPSLPSRPSFLSDFSSFSFGGPFFLPKPFMIKVSPMESFKECQLGQNAAKRLHCKPTCHQEKENMENVKSSNGLDETAKYLFSAKGKTMKMQRPNKLMCSLLFSSTGFQIIHKTNA